MSASRIREAVVEGASHVEGESFVEGDSVGELAAFEDLVSSYGESVIRFIERRTRDHHDAEDLAQETFLQALCALDQLRSLDNIQQWVFKIAFHLTMDWLRSRTRAKLVFRPLSEEEESIEVPVRCGFAADPGEPEAPLDRAVSRVVREVRSLPDDYGIVLVLRYLEELSCREIAALLRISISSVKVKLFRARRLLRRRLGSLEEEVMVGLT